MFFPRISAGGIILPPHCILGLVWAAKTLYPERFHDVDMVKVADEFYRKYLGYSFKAMGGKL